MSTPATNSDVEYLPVRVYKSSGGGTANSVLLFSFNVIAEDTSRTALFANASDITPSSYEVEAGRFITFVTGSPTTTNGTADNGTIGGTLAFFLDWAGTLAFFLDWAPKFDPTKWDDGSSNY
jgi:hypothetical protein